MVLVSGIDHSLLLVFLDIPISIYRSFSSVLTAFVLHVWMEYSGRVYFMNFLKEGGGNRRNEKRNENERKKEAEKIVNLA